MWHTILFDLDGTLTDPRIGITSAFAYALRKYGIEADPDALTAVIGPPLKDSFMELYGFSEERAMEAIREYRVYFSDRGWAENVPYPGIAALLEKLRSEGRRLLVATSKPEEFTLRIMEHFDLARYFTRICGAPMDESDGGRKENVIAAALRREGVETTEGVVMIGDRRYDIFGAHQNGIPAIGVLYGYGSREELADAGADYITESVRSLDALLHEGG